MRFSSPLQPTRSPRVLITFAILILALFGAMQWLALSSRVQAISTNIVISEFRVRGPNGGNDEFIELYNLSGAPVAIGDWKIRGSNVSGTIGDRATIRAGTILQPGCHYLLTNSSTTAGPYSGAVLGDQTYVTGIGDDGGLALTLPNDTIVDQVGMSATSAFKEGTPLANLGGTSTSNLNRGYERKPGGAAGSGTDTDNNSADFQLITPSDPQNSTTGCAAPSPTPTATPTPTPTATPTPSPSPSPLVNVIINEIDSDTPSTDAAEFVELYDGGVGNTSLTGLVVVFYNGSTDTSYRAMDLDGFSTNAAGYFTLGNPAVPGVGLSFPNNTLQNGEDAVALYAANASDFPNGTAVTTANLRDAVVYDTADPDDAGLLVLLNASQPQVDESSGTGPDVDSIGRCPNGDGGARNTTTYVARPPTPNAANNCPAPPPPAVVAKIHEIQGNGDTSPFAGQSVISSGIVTGRKSNGFFMQEPDATVDSDASTSEGIFVFTAGAPPVAVGDSVTVTGTATEFFNLTQIASSASNVSISSSGNLLPAPIVLTTTIVSPAGPTNQLERFEGMRVHADTLVSVAPTNEFGEIFTVLDGVARPMREPGIEISLPVPPDPTSGVPDCCVPRWDQNPERIVVDSDGLVGSTRINVTSNVTLSNITGPLDFTFSFYKVLPQATPTTSANISAVPVPTPAAGEFTVAGFNIENFNNGNATQRRKAVLAIRDVLHLPDIIGTIEIASLAALQALANEIETVTGVHYEARLLGTTGTQQVGFLIQTPRIQIDSVFQDELPGCEGNVATCNTFPDPTTGAPQLLNDRPPLVLRGTVDASSANPRQVIVVVNHLRSFIDIEGVNAEGARVRGKRKAQAEFLANLLQNLQSANPGTPVISIGDYNAYQFSDGYTDPIATIKGTPTADDQIVVDASPDLVTPDFVNLTDTLPADQRYSFIFEGTPQALDHFVINTAANAVLTRYHIARNNADFPESTLFVSDATRPERNSDHDMPIGYFKFPKAVTTTTVSNASAVFSLTDQNVTLTANVSGPATISEGTVTFTVTDAANNVIGVPVVGNVSGGAATANYVLPGGTTPQALTITGVFSGGDFTLTSNDTATLSVTFNICLLYDPGKAVKSGAAYPIKIQLCDVNGNNVSSADIVVHAVKVQQISTSIDGDVITAGSANGDSDFRFDTGSYVLNLKTTGLSTGTYKLYFTAGNDPVQHSVEFQVK